MTFALAIFDLDGTLLDSDEALAAPFVELGVPRRDVTFGHVVAEECARLGIDVEDYLSRYDVDRAQPYPGVDAVVRRLRRWAVCSNKVASAGVAELERLGWAPEVAMFADDFGGPKHLTPVLERLEVVDRSAVVFVGDTGHDRACARDVGVAFAVAAWNPRATPDAGDLVLAEPSDLLSLVDVGPVR